MRILVLINRPQRRGAEVFGLDLRTELRRRGHEARLISLYGEPQEGDEDFVDVALGGRSDHPLERVPGFHPLLLRCLVRETRDFSPHVVQVHGSRTVKYGSLLRRVDRQTPFQLVYRNIGDPTAWVGSALRARIYRSLVLSQMDGIVAVSEATRESVLEIYRPSVPVAQIPRGVDLDRLQPTRGREDVRRELGTARDRSVVLFVGSLTPEKRPDRFFRVLARACSEENSLEAWILGDGPLRSELEAEARELLPHFRTLFLGVQSRIANYLGAADLLVLTSDTEGMPGVLLEAGALGVACVATRVGGVEEILIAGQTGLVRERCDETGLAQDVSRLLHDPTTRRRLGQRARERALANNSIRDICERYVDFYQSLMTAKEGGL